MVLGQFDITGQNIRHTMLRGIGAIRKGKMASNEIRRQAWFSDQKIDDGKQCFLRRGCKRCYDSQGVDGTSFVGHSMQ